jgi:penicillin-binding protein 1A
MFDNNGMVTQSRTYSKLCDVDGNVIIDNTPKQTIAISDVTAYWVTSLLQTAATSGTGSEANLGSMPTAGKTGTSGDKKDRWFAGYTPYYVAVVWTGFDTPATMRVSGNPSAQLWKKVMSLVHEELPYKEFSTPPDPHLEPVEGVAPEVPYIIRGVTLDGEVLYEMSESGVKGRDITVIAVVLEAYENVGSTEKTLTLDADIDSNLIEFFYKPIETAPTDTPAGDPTGEPTDEPTNEPTDEPTSEPTDTPTSEPPPTTASPQVSASPAAGTPTETPLPSPSPSPEPSSV